MPKFAPRARSRSPHSIHFFEPTGHWFVPLLGLAVFSAPCQIKAEGLSPESPEVRATIDKGIKFIETSGDGRLGGKALVGLTLAKYGASHDHKQIKDAIETIRAAVKPGPAKFQEDIYSTGLAIMFLVAIDPQAYRYEIADLVKSLHLRQKEEGAWGYPTGAQAKTCDTSMTQFAVLGLWEAADQAEVETPPEVWEKVANWIFRTQDPAGGFGYQGNYSKSLADRVKQGDPRPTMTVAALCSMYICKDQLGLSNLRRRRDDDIPKTLRRVETDDERKARAKTKIDVKWFNRTRSEGNHWMSENFTIEKPRSPFQHYYLYALERYESFREEEAQRVVRMGWYEQGARFLIRTQKEDGSWESAAGSSPDTCFSLLFLLRSAKKSLERSKLKFRESILVGGQGIPVAPKVRVRNGAVTETPAATPLAESLALLRQPLAEQRRPVEFELAIESLADLAEKGDAASIEAEGESLERLATSENRDVRQLAVMALSRAANLDHVPALISALADADLEVMLAARDGLLEISHRPATSGPAAAATDQERQTAIDDWRSWYKSIRPDARLD